MASIGVGVRPDGLALDAATGTLYVANSGSSTVSVVDVRHCFAGDTSACGNVAATVPVGASPGASFGPSTLESFKVWTDEIRA